MPVPITIIFCGSFQDYSSLVLESLIEGSKNSSPEYSIVAVVTTPPHPQGRSKVPSPNPVHSLAESHQLPVFTPEQLDDPASISLPHCDYLITAGYGKLLPTSWLNWPTIKALNIHFSYLPEFRGANPVEWALLFGEDHTGISVIEMNNTFDTGGIFMRKKLHISSSENRLSAYKNSYQEAGRIISEVVLRHYQFSTERKPIVHFQSTRSTEHTDAIQHKAATKHKDEIPEWSYPPLSQPNSPTPYAARFLRSDGYVPWLVLRAITTSEGCAQTFHQMWDEYCPTVSVNKLYQISKLVDSVSAAVFLGRAARALAGFPSLWSEIPTSTGLKRIKIFTTTLSEDQKKVTLEKVQVAGQNPSLWNQVKNSIVE